MPPTPTTRHQPPQYTPDSQRPPSFLGVSRPMLMRHVVSSLVVGFLVWLATTAKTTYTQSVADPPLAQSRFIAESLRREKQRTDFFGQARVDSVVMADEFKSIHAQLDAITTQLHCLSRPHPSGC